MSGMQQEETIPVQEEAFTHPVPETTPENQTVLETKDTNHCETEPTIKGI